MDIFIYYGILLLCMLISIGAQIRVSTAYAKYSKVAAHNGLTGAMAARHILDSHGLYHVQIEPIRGKMTDHFDPRANVVRLSEGVYQVSSVAAVGIAAHECGHAIQYAEKYAPLRFRNAIVKSTNFCSNISFLLILIGLVISVISEASYAIGTYFIYAGIIAFAAVAFFQLVTLPVEFNASRRALVTIENSHMLSDNERQGARKVLSAAAMTYVAALVVSLLQLLRLVLIFGDRKR